MNSKCRVAVSYLIGVLSGFVLLTGIAAFSVYRDKGKPLASARVFGDVRITPCEVGGGALPDVEELLLVEVGDEAFLTLFFDDERRLSQMSFRNDEAIIGTVMRVHADDSWRGFIYGNDEEFYDTYTDIDFDGSFDLRYVIGEGYEVSRYIELDGVWVKADKCSYEEATIDSVDEKLTYVFKGLDGWQEVE
jgi:hypothetical protein